MASNAYSMDPIAAITQQVYLAAFNVYNNPGLNNAQKRGFLEIIYNQNGLGAAAPGTPAYFLKNTIEDYLSIVDPAGHPVAHVHHHLPHPANPAHLADYDSDEDDGNLPAIVHGAGGGVGAAAPIVFDPAGYYSSSDEEMS